MVCVNWCFRILNKDTIKVNRHLLKTRKIVNYRWKEIFYTLKIDYISIDTIFLYIYFENSVYSPMTNLSDGCNLTAHLQEPI